MVTAGVELPVRRDPIKGLAMAGIVGAALVAATGLWWLIDPYTADAGAQILNPTAFQITGVASAVGYVGWLAAAIAFYQVGAMGRGRLARFAIGLLATGLVVAIGGQINDVFAARSDVQIGQAPSWLLFFQMLAFLGGPVLLSVAALQARLTPLWVALYPFLVLALGTIAGWSLAGMAGLGAGVPIILTGLAYMGFAAIVYTGRANPRAT